MYIEFQAITIEGFTNFAAPQTLQLNRSAGLYSISGFNEFEPELETNSIGKSTITDALTWVLFHRTTRGIHGPSIQSWFPHEKCQVSVDFNREIVKSNITRTQAPNSLTILGVESTDHDVPKFLGIDLEKFLTCVITGQISTSFIDLTPKAKLDFFSSILELALWEKCSDLASEKNAKLEKQLLELSNKLNTIQAQRGQLQSLMTSLQEREIGFDKEKSQSINNLATKVDAQKTDLKSKEEKLQSSESEIKQLQTVQDNLLKLAATKQNEVNSLYLESADFRLAKAKIQTEMDRLSREFSKWQKITDECPWCEQPVPAEKSQANKAEIAKSKSLLREKLRTVSTQEIEHQTKVKFQETELIQINKNLKIGLDRINQAEKNKTKLELEILETRLTLKNLEKDLERTRSLNNPYATQISEHRIREQELDAELSKISNRISEQLVKQKRLSWWIKGFRDLRLWITKQALETFTNIINQTLAKLGLSGWTIHSDVERQTQKGSISKGLNFTIINQLTKEQHPIEIWSGGILQRLKLAIQWGLAFLVEAYSGFRANIMILDEPANYLSKAGQYQLLEFLSDEAQRLGKAIYVIDHHSAESPFFKGNIWLTKTSSGTVIDG